VTGRKEK